MDIREGVRSDAGRVPVGFLVTLGVLGLAATAAYFFLGNYGVWDQADEPSPSPVIAEPSPEPETSPAPAWLTDPSRTLPPLLAIDDDRELPARLMADWVWEFVGQDWDLVLVRHGTGDGITYLNDFQVLYLEAPDEELFRLWELRQDYDIDVVHWDPALAVAWLERGGRPGLAPVVELDLRSGTVTTDWAGSAVASANNLPDGVGNVMYVGEQADGKELWASFDSSGATTGLFWRTTAGRFIGSVMNDEIRRLQVQGFSDDRGIDAWVDPDSMTAVYRAAFRVGDEVREDRWILHRLDTDDFQLTVPQVPNGADCRPPGNLLTPGQFDGDRILAMCRVGNSNTGTFLDPTGDNPPR